MTWKIKAVAGPFVGQEVIIDQSKVIGRDPSVDVVLQGGHISRRHAELSLRNGDLWLKDLNSSNGTFVNGTRIDEQQLHDNDEFQIDVVCFLVLSTLEDTLRAKTSESVSLTQEGLPTRISVPKPAPMPAAQPQPVSATPEPISSQKASSSIKNTLPAALGMAVLILIIMVLIWYFVT